jgi:NADH-quinone oxidoreductase subunit G
MEGRGEEGIRLASFKLNGIDVNLAVVHGLKSARSVVEKVRKGELKLDLIEVMACPGGCVGGAGQPVVRTGAARKARTRGLYDADKNLDLHKSQDNPFVRECYQKHLGEVGGHTAHALLHTHYQSRRRVEAEDIALGGAAGQNHKVNVCVGTNCFIKGSQRVLQDMLDFVERGNLFDKVQVGGSFCLEQCEHGPNAMVDGQCVQTCTAEKLRRELEK